MIRGLKSHSLFFDGACEPVNPNGIMGMGFIVYDSYGKVVNEHSSKEYLGDNFDKTSNNLAEYLSLKKGLDYCLKKGISVLQVFGDSSLVVKQMRPYATSKMKGGEMWAINGGIYKPIALECTKLMTEFRIITIDWIPREINTVADELSKKLLPNATDTKS